MKNIIQTKDKKLALSHKEWLDLFDMYSLNEVRVLMYECFDRYNIIKFRKYIKQRLLKRLN